MAATYGGIEAGGTKFVCAVGTGPEDVRAAIRFPTTTPGETLGRALQFFRAQAAKDPLAAVGIASFGPVNLDSDSPTFGYITTTPKPGWANTDLAGAIQRGLQVPVSLDTDVNGAALAEHLWGAGQGLDPLLYLTVGTGIGGGALCNGRLLHGLVHPEMGHMRVPHDWAVDPYPGQCRYHGDCLEGLACGPALEERYHQRPETLSPDHPAWELQARYLGLALVNLICALSPECIVIGGGVLQQPRLLPLIHLEVQRMLNRYIAATQITDGIDKYIVPPRLGDRAGVLGGIALAQRLTK